MLVLHPALNPLGYAGVSVDREDAESPEVQLTRFSTGASFVLAERRTVLPVLNS